MREQVIFTYCAPPHDGSQGNMLLALKRVLSIYDTQNDEGVTYHCSKPVSEQIKRVSGEVCRVYAGIMQPMITRRHESRTRKQHSICYLLDVPWSMDEWMMEQSLLSKTPIQLNHVTIIEW